MENKFKIEIRLNVLDYNKELKDVLINNLKEILQQKYSDIIVKFINAEKYWKIPDRIEFMLEVISDMNISVEEFIKHFDIEWWYDISEVYNVNKKQSEYYEEAIWDKKTNNGVFLHDNVTWVSVSRSIKI